ncbi:insulinase family protein [Sphingomonas donggukensis]|uniref:Insulinase family protein n=1 Tax=Sphingomonas donggukensis TaxID=2949093 RepID=A0ABY4TYQ4_9SPHN|nr:pitrilysin family protein [Sphingomonas donggukensis]URW76786.1 insulinase family protein [Sphingomonas donggukensis]
MTNARRLLTALALSTAIVAPATARTTAPQPAKVLPATSYTLPNGLKVIFHIDRSDPVVSVVLAAHVGSSREVKGRTGFAHMFEHLFFLNSENLGPGGLDKLSARVGGTGANGSTSRDWTVYNQEVPRDALEKMIWAEADKLGYFIKTVTPAVLQKEKQVVKNEKRQSVDNRAFGHVQELLTAALYPADHPYNWPVIGSMADLDAAQLSDVQDFYRRWYTPNNATLTIAGDFDPAQAKAWVARYFGEIPRGEIAVRPAKRPVALTASKSLAYEDSYAKLPQLTIAWPTVGIADPDYVALEALYDLLTDGRDAPLTKLLVEDRKLTDAVSMGSYDSEIAGEAMLSVRAYDGVKLDAVRAAIDAGLAQFGTAGVDPAALARVKTLREAAIYAGIGDVDGKATTIARYEAQTGDPEFLDVYLRRLLALTPADIDRVFRRYIAGRPNVSVSAVPKGQPALALTGATMVVPATEPIVQGAEAEVDQTAGRTAYARTPSKIDRTKEPAFGPAPAVTLPAVWQATAANGLSVSGIEDRELPLVQFAMSADGGQLLDDPARPGAANLLARMMTRGTRTRTAAELEKALQSLGAKVEVSADRERIVLGGATLARNYDATMALVREMLLDPRWDANELALAKAAVSARIADERSNPQALASRVTNVVSYGPQSIYARNILGTQVSVAALSMADLKAAYARLSPGTARFRAAGAVTQAQVMASVAPLATRWTTAPMALPTVAPLPLPEKARLYFYDIPDAKQSLLTFTAPGPARGDADYTAAAAMNYILGGGGFASRLTQQLREGKGYTYGIRSGFTGWRHDGRFTLSSPVRANVTLESATLARSIMADYPRTFTADDLAVTKGYLTKSRAFQFEQLGDKLNMLALIGDYGLATDFPLRDARVVEGMTVEQVRALAAKYLPTARMTYVIVGDAATQAGRLDALGLGKAVPAKPLIE